MFTFRHTTYLFFALLLTLNILTFTGVEISYLWYVILVVCYLTISVAASFLITSGFHLKAICRRDTEMKVIALTFDDGPDPTNTPLILDILKDRAKATFFCIGKNIHGNEHLLKRMHEEGHLVGMHSYSHSHWFDFFPPKKMRREFEKTEAMIKEIIGKRPLLFRPPFGVINPFVKKALRHFPYHVMGFSNRSYDSVTKNVNQTLVRTLKNLKPGDIILFHDTVPYAPELLSRFLTEISDRGYIVVSIEDMFKITAYES
jgi:peptidoglycan/xylan/chitin deacetylase (PgdA/CDA1 family)